MVQGKETEYLTKSVIFIYMQMVATKSHGRWNPLLVVFYDENHSRNDIRFTGMLL